MNYELNEILKRCSETAAWFGVELKNIHSINHMDDTPLHTICSWGDPQAVKVLIEAGANVNARGDIGSSPLFNAVIGRNPIVVELLLNAGANRNHKNDDGRSALEYAKNIGAPLEVISILSKRNSKL